jgi:hypothetical protein
MIVINGSWYLPIDQAARQSIEADLGEPLDKEKHLANMELRVGKLGMFLDAFFKK